MTGEQNIKNLISGEAGNVHRGEVVSSQGPLTGIRFTVAAGFELDAG